MQMRDVLRCAPFSKSQIRRSVGRIVIIHTCIPKFLQGILIHMFCSYSDKLRVSRCILNQRQMMVR
jgi:hypothetical protein